MSPNILILADEEDYHALAVSEALERKGISHDLWNLFDFPTRQTASAWLLPERSGWEIGGLDRDRNVERDPSSVWSRRPGRPVLPQTLDPADRRFAFQECKAFLEGLQHQAGAEAFWVNPPEGFLRASSKLNQLRAAARSGFEIPRTLMSNDPPRIREFLAEHYGQVIYKSFYPVFWQSGERVAALFSTPLAVEDLPDDEVLRATPGIFQSLIPKSFELRVTLIGRHLFAARIDSQSVASARLDWRAARERVPTEPFDLPPAVARSCHRVLEELGIVFGCFDLVVTTTGEYVFLEVNEMGAFLWLEEQCPDLQLLDAFCEFLIQGRSDFQWSPQKASLRLRDVHDAAVRRMRAGAAGSQVRRPAEMIREA